MLERAGLSRFIMLTGAFCLAMIIAISGPPTRSETETIGTVAGHMVRHADSVALRFTFDLCDSLAVVAHTAGLCGDSAAVVAHTTTPARQMQVSAVSETVPAAAREILPPDTLDQITRPPRPRTILLGEGPPAPRFAAAHPPRANAARARSSRATAHRSTRAAAAHVRRPVAHPRPARARPHRAAPPARVVHTTPIAAPRRPAASPPAHPPPEPEAQARVTTPAVESAPPHENMTLPPSAPPEEQADAPPEEHAAPPPDQSDDDMPSNPESDELPSDDIKA